MEGSNSARVSGVARSMKRIPLVWSSSCWMARARRPSASNWIGEPSRIWALTRTESGRATSAATSGKLRQPSPSVTVFPKVSTSALRRTMGMRDSKSAGWSLRRMALGRFGIWGTSRTNIWSGSPTCWAARPRPSASRMVSIMSLARSQMRASIFSIRVPGVRRAGWSKVVMSRIMVCQVRVG